MEAIHHQIAIEATPAKIYGLISTKEGLSKWLTAEEGWKIEGDEAVGGTLTFYLHDGFHKMKVTGLEPNETVNWACTEGHPEWIGTGVTFLIDANNAQTVLDFEHVGWKAQTKFFEECNKAWEQYVSAIKTVAEI